MNEIDRLQQLAAASCRPSAPPPIDVSGSVLATLAEQPAPTPLLPFAIVAGTSALAALILAWLAFDSWSAVTDPLRSFMSHYPTVFQ